MSGVAGASIGPVELRRRIEGGEVIGLLDVREPIEREICAIPAGAGVADLFIPLREIPGRVEEIAVVAAVRPVVVYCHHGVRSEMARRWLAERGVHGLLNLEGGIDAYSLEADATVRRYG